MAQHDYVIANGTGAAVRSDLNNALAAIVSQNSGATEPATTYAFQFWADTTTNLLKLRNSANNAWVTLFQLDGEWSTLPVENGTAAAPSIYFKDSGTDTGFYSPGTDQVAISTGGTGRLFINSSGSVGIGTSSPQSVLNISAASGGDTSGLRITRTDAGGGDWRIWSSATANGEGAGKLIFGNSANRVTIDGSGNVGIGTTSVSRTLDVVGTGIYTAYTGNTGATFNIVPGANGQDGVSLTHSYQTGTGYGPLKFEINGEKARLTASGQFLVGTSSASATSTVVIQGNSASSTGNSILRLQRGDTTLTDGQVLGGVYFGDSTGTQSVEIEARRDGGTWSASSKPSRLLFSTTADGASSPTERCRISNLGKFYARAASTDVAFFSTGSGAAAGDSFISCRHSSTTVTDGTEVFRVRTTGDVQNTNNSYGAISDIKLKENIVDATPQWSDIKALQVRKYNFKEGQTHTQIGLVAQEVELVSPGLVSESPDRDEDGNDLGTVTKSVNYSVLYMKAVKALQEAMERIEQLETSNADLLARVTALESA